MAGVKTESGYMIPSDKAPKIANLENTVTDQPENDNRTVANSYGELSGSSRKDDNSDSDSRQPKWELEKTFNLQMVADSLYTSKHRYKDKDKSVNVAGMNGGSTQLSGLFKVDAKIESCLGKLGRKKSLLKSSSLVSRPIRNNKNKLIDGILGSLRKSSESSSTI
ncbi:hypothetical protein PanWU01x14_262410 [Parasponia andersonii]|uniref:Uncharacterized protein n=1 Tax=Parasponia andersonii TaxID=3476 RepID=A0A2P5B842_PARAD|nr:hypothetical protein PanWU01x14_262410 [Parasponia andersonii]